MNLATAKQITAKQQEISATLKLVHAFFNSVDTVINSEIDTFSIVSELGFDGERAKAAYNADDIEPYYFEVYNGMKALKAELRNQLNALPNIPILLRIELKKAN